MTNKILYFEGAGWDGANADYNGLNCRIRTAFHDDNDKMIYLELHGFHPLKEHIKEAKNKKIELPLTHLYIDSAHYITDDLSIDDENENRIKINVDYKEMLKIPYTLDNIKDFINKHFNSSFDEVVILNHLAGYRVFADYKKSKLKSERYNFGDCFGYDAELTKKRIAKVIESQEHFKKIFNQQYDNTSYYIENGELTVCINATEQKRIAAGYIERKFVIEV